MRSAPPITLANRAYNRNRGYRPVTDPLYRAPPSIDQRPLVSIIIPCWNAEAYVGDAIDSALSQTYPNVEVIVIDDGSTDGSLEVIRSFGKRIRWETGANQGGGNARNRGIELALGTFVQFLDADDLLDRDKIGSQLASLATLDADCITCDRREFRQVNSDYRIVRFPPIAEHPLDWMLSREDLRTTSPLHPLDWLVRAGGFDGELPCAQEYDLHLRLVTHGCRFHHESTARWTARLTEGSVSSDYGKVLAQHSRIFRRLGVLAEATNNGTSATAANHLIAKACVRSARNALKLGANETARELIQLAAELAQDQGISQYKKPIERVLARSVGIETTERLTRLYRTARACLSRNR